MNRGTSSRQTGKGNKPAMQTAECSSAWSQAEPGNHARQYFKTRFSGRQKVIPAGCVARAFAALLFSLSFGGCSHSVNPGTTTPVASPVQISSSAQVVKVSTMPVSINSKASADATVTLSILPDFHINANPATFPYLIATELQPGNLEGLTIGKSVYPSAIKKNFQFAEQPLAVYEGQVSIKLPLQVSVNAKKGGQSLPIKVRVQACDSEKCYPPATLDGSIPVNVN